MLTTLARIITIMAAATAGPEGMDHLHPPILLKSHLDMLHKVMDTTLDIDLDFGLVLQPAA